MGGGFTVTAKRREIGASPILSILPTLYRARGGLDRINSPWYAQLQRKSSAHVRADLCTQFGVPRRIDPIESATSHFYDASVTDTGGDAPRFLALAYLSKPPSRIRRSSRFIEDQRLYFLLAFVPFILGNLREIGVDHFPALDRDVVFFVFHGLLPFDLFDLHCLPVPSHVLHFPPLHEHSRVLSSLVRTYERPLQRLHLPVPSHVSHLPTNAVPI